MTISQAEIAYWHQRIIADKIGAQRSLDWLEKLHHQRFVALCHVLAEDDNDLVRHIALRKLGQNGDREDAEAESRALEALDHPDLQCTALFALGRIGTAKSFPTLLSYAQSGSSIALASAAQQVRTPADADEVLALARRFIMAPGGRNYYLREESVGILLRYSTASTEQRILLSAARRYADDVVVEALADASTEAIGDLLEIRSTYPEDCVEYKTLSRTIDTLEKKRAH